MEPFQNLQIENIFDAYPNKLRAKLMILRQLIFDTAAEIDGVGKLEEALKWGQPSYLTTESKKGSTIRIDQVKSNPIQYAMYFHCQTSLVSTYRDLFPGLLNFEGNRGLIFSQDENLPEDVLVHCIGMALTYHVNKGKSHLAI